MTDRKLVRLTRGTSALSALLLASTAFAAESPEIRRGRTFAHTYCAGCHVTGRVGVSPMAEAPPFRTLAQRYPLEDLAEPLVEGIRTGHPAMPEWHLDPGDVQDLIAYMRTIQEKAPPIER